MYKVYYLTSETDFNIPMYVGMTKQTLKKRLKEHLDHRRKLSKQEIWKRERRKELTIHLIQDNILTFSECADIELYWIQYWKERNPNLKNSIIWKLSDHPYINRIENIKRNISEGVIRKKCKSIVVLDLKQNFINEFRTIKEASKEIKVKEEIISKNLKNITKAKKFIFLYKEEYNPDRDYSYKVYDIKKRKKCSIKPLVSEKCRESVRKSITVINIITNETFYFDTQQKACDFTNCSNALISRYKKNGKVFKSTFKFL